MTTSPTPSPSPGASPSRVDAAAAWAKGTGGMLLRNYHRYGQWLISISWWRFAFWALVWLGLGGIVFSLPLFDWHWGGERLVHVDSPSVSLADLPQVRVRVNRPPPEPPAAPPAPQVPQASAVGPASSVSALPVPPPAVPAASAGNIGVSIGERGVHIFGVDEYGKPVEVSVGRQGVVVNGRGLGEAADQGPDDDSRQDVETHDGVVTVNIDLPTHMDAQEIADAVEEATQAANEAIRSVAEARMDAHEAALDESRRYLGATVGDTLMQLLLLWVAGSTVLKFVYRRQVQAEVLAARATETAEAESLRRQVVEARMAAMQAQVEPHFLFNTLASIEHLIENDPPRASQMQNHLIALLRASMPSMRDTSDAGVKDLRREMTLVRPYVEILKMRMDERLDARIDVPDGLLSAEFPPLMLQTLVENAIRHGLEPKPEGGMLRVTAEVADGKLKVSVADTGVGFGQARVGGTGTGLANIRERLQMSYGQQAALTITANAPSGTVTTITLPYRSVSAASDKVSGE